MQGEHTPNDVPHVALTLTLELSKSNTDYVINASLVIRLTSVFRLALSACHHACHQCYVVITTELFYVVTQAFVMARGPRHSNRSWRMGLDKRLAAGRTKGWNARGGGAKEKVDPYEGNPMYQKCQKKTLKRGCKDLPVLKTGVQRQIRDLHTKAHLSVKL